MVRKKYGNHSPTQAVILPYVKKQSAGVEVIEIYEKIENEFYRVKERAIKTNSFVFRMYNL